MRAIAVALTVGGISSSVAVADTAGASTNHRTKSLVVSTAKNATYGTILVSGNTVYTVKASKTPCGTACQKFWSEVLLPKGVKKAKAGPGVNAAKLGTIKRGHGALQVTYKGKALYRFSLDTAPGQVNGNITNTWGTWSVVVTAKPASAPLVPAPGATSVPTTPSTAPSSTTRPTTATSPTTAPMTTPAPVSPAPTTTPTTSTPTTTAPTTTPTTSPPTTTTTAPGGGGVGF